MPTPMTIDGSSESKSEVASEVQLDAPATEKEVDLLHQMYGLLFFKSFNPILSHAASLTARAFFLRRLLSAFFAFFYLFLFSIFLALVIFCSLQITYFFTNTP